jgi:hypothetical protein
MVLRPGHRSGYGLAGSFDACRRVQAVAASDLRDAAPATAPPASFYSDPIFC